MPPGELRVPNPEVRRPPHEVTGHCHPRALPVCAVTARARVEGTRRVAG